jgi:hypothetical protein
MIGVLVKVKDSMVAAAARLAKPLAGCKSTGKFVWGWHPLDRIRTV